MVNNVFFSQSCPVCGRSLRIVVTLLGHRVYCQHCGGGFIAMDDSLRSKSPPGERSRRPADAVEALIERADWTLRQSGVESPDCGYETTATD
ncbi:MAG TPA: response regulator [Planctomycetaceae bacterium]|jgi:hypothetical protein|nr:response regulator [Planctomycetaceae bacterium]